MRFIMLHRLMDYIAKGTTPTWVNIRNINTISESLNGDGTRITMRDGFLVVSESVTAVLDAIRRAEDER